ncbi:MAG: DUF1569 domain-containing protein [Gemmatimonadaceae bacterium]|nr:DUF1569 domain-containing protein [Gemmatimonadaceae bacterium]
MATLFDPTTADSVKARLQRLDTNSARQWGKMNAAQALAHCTVAIEIALGDQRPPRMMIGRLIGGFVKRLAIGNNSPMKKNSPTAPGFVVSDERVLETERGRLLASIDRFVTAGSKGTTNHPHAFFGQMSGDEWGELMYKHMDHHLRQFGA